MRCILRKESSFVSGTQRSKQPMVDCMLLNSGPRHCPRCWGVEHQVVRNAACGRGVSLAVYRPEPLFVVGNECPPKFIIAGPLSTRSRLHLNYPLHSPLPQEKLGGHGRKWGKWGLIGGGRWKPYFLDHPSTKNPAKEKPVPHHSTVYLWCGFLHDQTEEKAPCLRLLWHRDAFSPTMGCVPPCTHQCTWDLDKTPKTEASPPSMQKIYKAAPCLSPLCSTICRSKTTRLSPPSGMESGEVHACHESNWSCIPTWHRILSPFSPVSSQVCGTIALSEDKQML